MMDVIISSWATYLYLGYVAAVLAVGLWARMSPAAPPPACVDSRGNLRFPDGAQGRWRPATGREGASGIVPRRSDFPTYSPSAALRGPWPYPPIRSKARARLGVNWGRDRGVRGR